MVSLLAEVSYDILYVIIYSRLDKVFNVHIQSKLLQHTPMMGARSGQGQSFHPRQRYSDVTSEATDEI